MICKNGAVNVEKRNIDNKSRRYIKDLFTTLIDAKWRYTFIFFVSNLVISWTLFASFWYLLALLHGDIDYYARMKESEDEDQFMADNQFKPCVRELYGFMSAFLFSIETQHTIGEGIFKIFINFANFNCLKVLDFDIQLSVLEVWFYWQFRVLLECSLLLWVEISLVNFVIKISFTVHDWNGHW